VIELRACQGHEEMEACVRLQIEVWGYDPSDVIRARHFWWRRRLAARRSAHSIRNSPAMDRSPMVGSPCLCPA